MKIYLKDRIGEHCVRRIDEETHKDGASILEFIRNNWEKENEIVISLEGVRSRVEDSLFYDGNIEYDYY